MMTQDPLIKNELKMISVILVYLLNLTFSTLKKCFVFDFDFVEKLFAVYCFSICYQNKTAKDMNLRSFFHKVVFSAGLSFFLVS